MKTAEKKRLSPGERGRYARECADAKMFIAFSHHDYQIADNAPVEFVDGGSWVTLRIFVPESSAS